MEQNRRKKKPYRKKKLYRSFLVTFLITAIVVLATTIALGFVFVKHQLRREALAVADEVIAFRQWITNTSVVWVNNPHPDFPDYLFKKEFKAGDGTQVFYAKNPALATRELSTVYAKLTKGINFRVTSDDYRNPANKPDQFELEAIQTFKANKEAKFAEKFETGKYRYAQPLKVVSGCLKCHGKPEDAPPEVIEKYGYKAFGYKVGDIRGIITVNIPMEGLTSILGAFGPLTYIVPLILILTFALNLLWFRKRVMMPISVIESGISYIKAGDYQHRIDVPVKDEFSDIADTFNETMDKMTAYIQTGEERNKQQESIINFLDLLSTASEGDLTQKAEVTADIFGSLGDAYNLMIEGLTDLIVKVKGAADDVRKGSEKMLEILKEMESDSERQLAEIKKTSEAVDEAALSAVKVSELTDSAQKIAGNAIDASERGSKTVTESIDGIQLIRLTIQAINKRMKFLAEKLMEIGTISQLITEIANRTNLLAINASIEASRAGEQGKGFIVIAEEIRGLAERSTKSTKQIGDILRSIQAETAEVTRHLEELVNFVEKETALANEAGNVFRVIKDTIKDVGGIISEIRTAAETQNELTSKVVISMEDVQRVALSILKIALVFSDISKSLSDTSRNLVSSTDRFRISIDERKEIEN